MLVLIFKKKEEVQGVDIGLGGVGAGMRMFAGDLGDTLRRLRGFYVLKVKVQGLWKSRKEVKKCVQG